VEAAALVKVVYDRAEGAFDLASAKDTAVTPKTVKPESLVGDFEAAFAAAPVQLDETYTTPDHAHAMMEPHASTALWNGDQLTVWTSNQLINRGRTDLATTLGVPKENVRIVSPLSGAASAANFSCGRMQSWRRLARAPRAVR
jgi:xanthine dehydrogenase YagR molybdenum-binding subunit